MQENKPSLLTINISTISVLKILLLLLVLWFLYLVRDILVLILLAVFLSTIFEPFVNFLNKRKVPRSLAVILIYVILILVVGSMLYILIPPLIEQASQLASSFPIYWEKVLEEFDSFRVYSESRGLFSNLNETLQNLKTTFTPSFGNIFSLFSSVFGNVISFIIVMVLTFYFLLNQDAIKKTFKAVTPGKYRPYLTDVISRVQQRLSAWLRGELILGLIIGCLTLIGLWILGIKYFLVLALVAGILELVPYVGPVLGAIPAVLLAFTQSPFKALAVLIMYWLIQQMENHLIVPKVMQKAVGLNPIVIIIVILIGARLMGFVGVLLAVPTAAAVSVVIKDFFEKSEISKAPSSDQASEPMV